MRSLKAGKADGEKEMVKEFFEAFGHVVNNCVIYIDGFYISYREIICILIGILSAVVFDAAYTALWIKGNGEQK